jgi:hypothetical protein
MKRLSFYSMIFKPNFKIFVVSLTVFMSIKCTCIALVDKDKTITYFFEHESKV